jgi:hypothetical protein
MSPTTRVMAHKVASFGSIWLFEFDPEMTLSVIDPMNLQYR